MAEIRGPFTATLNVARRKGISVRQFGEMEKEEEGKRRTTELVFVHVYILVAMHGRFCVNAVRFGTQTADFVSTFTSRARRMAII